MPDKDNIHSETPYNWCDYRCDRCEFTKRCAVYKDEKAAKLKYFLQGRNPNSMDVTGEIIADSFEKSIELLKKMCEEKGFSWDEIEKGAKDVPSPPDFRKAPLFQAGEKFCLETHNFLKWAREEIFISPEIQNYFDELEYYSMLIPPKIVRMASAHMHEDADYLNEDRRKTAAVIKRAMGICRESLLQIAGFRPQTLEHTQNLLKFLSLINLD